MSNHSSLLLQGNHLMTDQWKRPCHVTYVSAVQAATGDLSQNGASEIAN